jgi:hypothetical protein
LLWVVVMTKATILAITTFVWSAGFAATGAFVYTVTKPLPKPITVASMPAQRMPHTPPQGTIVLAPIEIVGEIPQPEPPAPVHASIAAAAPQPVAKAPAPRAIHCSEWRPLEQGSASVQICE